MSIEIKKFFDDQTQAVQLGKEMYEQEQGSSTKLDALNIAGYHMTNVGDTITISELIRRAKLVEKYLKED